MFGNKFYNRNRKIVFYSFLLFTVFLICFSAYYVFDYGVTLMYAEAPGGWYDSPSKDVTTQRLYEEIKNVQLGYMRMLIVSVFQLILGIILFLCTNRSHSQQNRLRKDE
jgi:hypothetical protein